MLLRKIPKPNASLILAAIFAAIGFFYSLIVSSGNVFLIARSFYNFTSFFIVLYLSIIFSMRFQGALAKIIVSTNIIWILGALLEVAAPSLVSALGNSRTSPGRGLTSFAPEPTFFALTMLLYILSIDANSEIKSQKKIYLTLIFADLFAIIFLAKSSMVIMFLLISFLLFIFSDFVALRFRAILRYTMSILVGFVFLHAFGVFDYLGRYRVGDLVDKVVSVGVFEIVKIDASINERIQHIVFSLNGAFNNLFLPNGLDNFSKMWSSMSPFLREIFWYGKPDDKIMSWIGDWVYSLGLFGMFSLVMIARLMVGIDKSGFFRLCVLCLLLVSAIPVASPFVPLLLGIEIASLQKTRMRYQT